MPPDRVVLARRSSDPQMADIVWSVRLSHLTHKSTMQQKKKQFGKHILTLIHHSLIIDTMTSILALTLLFTLFVTAQSFTFAPFRSDTNRGSFSLALREKPKQMAPEEKTLALEKATKAMTAFTNKYLKNTGTTLCSDKVNYGHFHFYSIRCIVLLRGVLTRHSHSHHVQSVAAVVVKGLAEHKVSLGSPLCPCRFYEGTLHIQTTRRTSI